MRGERRINAQLQSGATGTTREASRWRNEKEKPARQYKKTESEIAQAPSSENSTNRILIRSGVYRASSS